MVFVDFNNNGLGHGIWHHAIYPPIGGATQGGKCTTIRQGARIHKSKNETKRRNHHDKTQDWMAR